MTSTLLVINTNGNSNEANRVRILKIKGKGDPVEKYMSRKDAHDSDFIFELTDGQINKLKNKLNEL